MPGSGKTTLGRELAAVLKVPFVDLDLEIIKRENRSIESIFTESGEAYFRAIEKEVVGWSSGLKAAVVSTGGGAACFFDNLKVMKAAGTSVYLKVSIEELVKRMQLTAGERPMLKGKSRQDLFEFLQGKLTEREPYYLQADLVVTGDDISVDELVKAVVS